MQDDKRAKSPGAEDAPLHGGSNRDAIAARFDEELGRDPIARLKLNAREVFAAQILSIMDRLPPHITEGMAREVELLEATSAQLSAAFNNATAELLLEVSLDRDYADAVCAREEKMEMLLHKALKSLSAPSPADRFVAAKELSEGLLALRRARR